VSDPAIGAVYDSGGFGATIGVLIAPLGNFGKFCLALWWLGSSANLVGSTYSNSLVSYASQVEVHLLIVLQAAQIFGFGLDKIPRFLFAILSTIIYTVIAIAGRDKLVEVVEDFLSILSYWVTAYFVIIFEEHFFFRLRTGYNKDVWNSPKLLPPGIAAIASFWIGVIGMVSFSSASSLHPFSLLRLTSSVSRYGTELVRWPSECEIWSLWRRSGGHFDGCLHWCLLSHSQSFGDEALQEVNECITRVRLPEVE